jgi:hypothetical protein
MNPPSRTRERPTRVRTFLHWRVLAPVLAGAIAPKCLLCVAAYIGGGAALFGLRPELCGASSSSAMTFLPPLAGAALGASIAAWRHRRRPPASPSPRALD